MSPIDRSVAAHRITHLRCLRDIVLLFCPAGALLAARLRGLL